MIPVERRLPELSGLTSDTLIFVVDGIRCVGHYHANGWFYCDEHSDNLPRMRDMHMDPIYMAAGPRAIPSEQSRLREGHVDVKATHWCYVRVPVVDGPNFEKTNYFDHELKTDGNVYDAVRDGVKKMEIRFNDREFQAGEILKLRKTVHTGSEMSAGAELKYVPGAIYAQITHMMEGPRYGLQRRWVIMSIETLAISYV